MTNLKEATREALEFLRTENKVGMVATVDQNSQPYLSPVYYIMDGDGFGLYFLTTNNTHKSKNIENNSKIAFTVGAGPRYKSVMIRGTAQRSNVSDEERIVSLLVKRIDDVEKLNWPLQKLDDLKDQNIILYKVNPEKVTFLNLDSSEEASGDHLFHLVN